MAGRLNVKTLGGPCLVALGSLLLATSAGCSGDDGNDLPSFNDVASAPQPIQRAAAAVVRIRTAGSAGTGSFVSPSGLLLTNNHVLGAEVCPIEGCSIQLSFMHQKDKAPTPPLTVFAIPRAVDVGLDMAVLQVNLGQDAPTPIPTPDYLSWSAHDAQSLLGTHVHVVGHPEGRLKKWTSGVVIDASGDWFSATAYTLPGDSGSPVLADDGSLVGIIHRGPSGEDLFTSNGVNVFSIGTASAPLMAAAMSASLPPVMISVAAPTTADEAVARSTAYINGRVPYALVDGAQVLVLSLLGQACDTALARTDYQSIESLGAALVPCNQALTWIECRSDATPAFFGTACPPPEDLPAWRARMSRMNDVWVAMNGNPSLTPVSFGIAALSFTEGLGREAAADSLQQALAAANQPLDFGNVNYLSAFGVQSYAGSDVRDWLRGYSRVPHYEFSATSIGSAFLWWLDNGGMREDEARSALQSLYHNPNVAIGSKLYFEDVAYASGW